MTTMRVLRTAIGSRATVGLSARKGQDGKALIVVRQGMIRIKGRRDVCHV
jgi:hypothetical protein